MPDLPVLVFYTEAGGTPSVGLALADIDLYLTEVNRVTLAQNIVWDGTQHPTAEITNMGAYARVYATADLDVNVYIARGTYTGAVALDQDDVTGDANLCMPAIGTAIEYTYTVTGGAPVVPIVGARIEITTDALGADLVWCGQTDTFGVARDDAGYLPRLEPGTYFVFRSAPGFTFSPNPQTVVVS